MIYVGTRAPQFAAQNQDGDLVRLADYHGKWVVLYFYPKDDTPGCTIEACSFRDHYEDISSIGAVVIGVSTDPVPSHQKFHRKYKLPFSIISDLNKSIVKSYGVWREKSFMGRKYWGTNRITVIIDKTGIVRHIIDPVKPFGHADEVTRFIKQIARSPSHPQRTIVSRGIRIRQPSKTSQGPIKTDIKKKKRK
jgi:thioredoxin-dependent peroxiredoxin